MQLRDPDSCPGLSAYRFLENTLYPLISVTISPAALCREAYNATAISRKTVGQKNPICLDLNVIIWYFWILN